MVTVEDTLRRLVSSGKCSCIDPQECIEQLRQLADLEADRIEAKRRGRFYKALADESRQRMLSLLLVRSMCVCELIVALKMTQPTTSHHLKILEKAGLVEGVKKGKWVYYGLRDRQQVSALVNVKI